MITAYTAIFIAWGLLLVVHATDVTHDNDHNNISHHFWLKMCRPHHGSSCCEEWRNKVVHARASQLKVEASNPVKQLGCFDLYEPSWNCELKSRLPEEGGDGPKWVCGIDHLPNKALVYSFGSNGDISFETGIRNKNPTAEIVVFDPTLTKGGAAYVRNNNFQLIEVGLGGVKNDYFVIGKTKFPSKNLVQHMKDLNHTAKTIDVLKVDIEGSEFNSFANLMIGECPNVDIKINQLQVEIHERNAADRTTRAVACSRVDKLFKQLDDCNLMMFSKERNHWGCAGYKCVEFSFISPSLAFHVFMLTHPSCKAH